MKTSMLKMTRLLVAAITGGTRSVASAIGRFAFVATALCATAVPLSSQAETPDYFVDWVQPSAALYVDTGITGKDGTKIELRAMCDADSFSGTRWPIILGSNKSNSNGRFNLAMFENWSGLKTRWEHGGSMPDHMDAAYYCDFKFEVEASSSGTMTGTWTRWDGTSQTATGSYGTLDTGLSMYLFATHYNDGSGDQAVQNFLGRLYYCKIWQIPDGGSDYALVRDLRPCVKDGVAGLYDAVSATIFYPPASGNALIAGPAKNDSGYAIGSVVHPATQYGRIHYAERSGMGNSGWMHLQLDDYTVRGVGDIANLNGGNTSWQGSNLKWSQVRFDGWFQVSSDKAGTWKINQKYDDYFAIFIDGRNVLFNNSYTGEANSTLAVTEGWHRFTIIAGDTYGGYGCNKNYSGLGSIPFSVSVNDGAAMAFNTTNFPQGSGTNVVTLDANADWQSLGPLVLNSGTVLDLKGHQLAVKDIYSDDFLGACITNSADGKAVLVFTGTPADSIAYKSGLVKEAGTKILFAKYGESSASWTGNGNDGGNALNANNWQDTLTEEPVLPTAAHAVSIVGSNVNLQIPSGSTFTCKSFEIGNCTFTAECDWSGLPVKPTITGTANLNGHVLTLNALSAVSGSTFSGGAGSFVEFVVNESATIANLYEYTYIENVGNLAFSGSAKILLRKADGGGTLTMTQLHLGNKHNVGMVQTNGTVNITSGANAVGESSGKTATYTMSGGSLTSAGEFKVGANGTGVFNQSGGTVTLNNWFSLGRHAGGNGTYTMTGGSLTANNTGTPLWIGAGDKSGNIGTGTLTIGGDATATFKGGIEIGRNYGARGYLTLNGGTLTVSRGDGFNVGRDGAGTFVQNGGTLTANEGGTGAGINNVWRIAWGVGYTGSYTLNDGTAIAKSNFYIGDGGTATYVQNGGTMTAENGVTLAVGNTAQTTFTLSGGVFNTKHIQKGSGTLNGVTFDGGTIVATNVTNGANFITGLNNVTYGPGGLTLDTAAYNVTMATASGANVAASVGSTFTKTGNGTLTVAAVPPVGNMVVSNGTLALSATCDNTAPVGIAHRWSFAGDLTDSVTGTAGTMSGSGATYEDGVVKLPGGSKGTCYIDLGANKLPSDSVTIEAWFTLRSQVDWTRVFVIGGSSGHYTVFNSRRSGDGNACNFDSLNGTQTVNTSGKVLAKDVQYYVAVTYTPDGNGGVIEKQYVKKVGDSGFIWNNTVTKANWSVTANAAQGYFWLGHSNGNDPDTKIDFDEVRIWNGALSADELALSVEKGPDASIAEISGSTLRLESGTTLAVGSGNTLTQPAVNANGTLASGSLVVTKQFNVTPGQSMTVASGATLDLTGADIVVTGEIPAGGCVIATAPSGGIVTAKPRKLTGDLDGYWLYLKSDRAYIGKRKGVMIIAK